MKQAAKTTQLFLTGTKRDALDLSLLWICSRLTKISSLQSTTSTSVSGKTTSTSLYSPVWSARALSILQGAGVPVEQESASLESPMELSTSGISWTSHISGQCNTLLDPLASLPWGSTTPLRTFFLLALRKEPFTFCSYLLLWCERSEMRTKPWMNIGKGRSRVWGTSTSDLGGDLRNHRSWGLKLTWSRR